jgi:hypothetical protein
MISCKQLPCINCITLPICKSYIFHNPKHHNVPKIILCRFLITEKECYDAFNYVFYLDRESDKRYKANIAKLSRMFDYLYHNIKPIGYKEKNDRDKIRD